MRADTTVTTPILIDTLGSFGSYGFVTLSFIRNFAQLDSNSINTNPLLDSVLHLTSLSPCIDAGNPDLDTNGQTWITDVNDQDPDGTRMDMGAFYYHHNPAGIENNVTENISVKVYPNPFSEYTTMEIINKKNQNCILTLYDLFGREVKKYEIRNLKTEISRDDLTGGMYFYQVTDNGQFNSSGKIIIQ